MRLNAGLDRGFRGLVAQPGRVVRARVFSYGADNLDRRAAKKARRAVVLLQ
jgi:hypothetical protein